MLLEVGDQPFYLDLPFYHVRLHCYFVIKLKTGPFKPEWAGKLNFYLSAVDDLLRTRPDGPTIGLLLCESHKAPIAEYALRDIAKPICVSTYRVTRELPAPIQGEVPSIEDLQEVVEKLRAELADLGSKPDGGCAMNEDERGLAPCAERILPVLHGTFRWRKKLGSALQTGDRGGIL